MKNSKISWCDHTFNPWCGCQKVSDGCKFCYAETLMDKRYGKVKWGPEGERKRTSKTYWKQPLHWNKVQWQECSKCGWRGPVSETHDFCPNCDGEELLPTRQRVFCASLCDIFEDNPQVEPWRKDVYGLIDATLNLDWLLLTKRPENINGMSPAWWHYAVPAWPANVWVGTSVENQEAADKRIPELLKVPARVRFLSMEPLLGPIDLSGQSIQAVWVDQAYADADPELQRIIDEEGWPIHWVIVGGESGQHARAMNPDWARSLLDQCQEANIPFLFKQWGEWRPFDEKVDPCLHMGSPDAHLAKMHWEYDLYRVGKHAAGRLLDGREWNEYPRPALPQVAQFQPGTELDESEDYTW